MSGKAKKLGRGLDSLIRRSDEPVESRDLEVQYLNPKSITLNRDQPRTEFDAEKIEELASSIKVHGLLQPLVVHIQQTGGYELIAGERRLRACLKLDLAQVPVVVKKTTPEQLLDLALIENIQREDLNPIELAEAYQNLKERHQWTQVQLAEHVGKKRSSVANTLRYLDLPDPIQVSLKKGEIREGHVKVLLSVADPEKQLAFYEQVIEWGLTVRDLEARIANFRQDEKRAPSATPATRRPPAAVDPQVRDQEERLAGALATKVSIKPGRQGKGRIVIEYYSHEDFERLKAILDGTPRG